MIRLLVPTVVCQWENYLPGRSVDILNSFSEHIIEHWVISESYLPSGADGVVGYVSMECYNLADGWDVKADRGAKGVDGSYGRCE